MGHAWGPTENTQGHHSWQFPAIEKPIIGVYDICIVHGQPEHNVAHCSALCGIGGAWRRMAGEVTA